MTAYECKHCPLAFQVGQFGYWGFAHTNLRIGTPSHQALQQSAAAVNDLPGPGAAAVAAAAELGRSAKEELADGDGRN
jgi:hypothetical protein